MVGNINGSSSNFSQCHSWRLAGKPVHCHRPGRTKIFRVIAVASLV
ncbi:MAG: hypothetical protein ACQSGP_00980 [Frankia sp.]